MKKLLFLLIIVGAGVGAVFGTKILGANRLAGMVADLEKFKVPADPYADPIEKVFVVDKKKGTKQKMTVTERWDFDHDVQLVVRACWAQRHDGILPLVLDLVKDTTKPANQRIAGMLVLGKSKDVKKEPRGQIVATLVAQLANTSDRVAEFAAFALGLLGHKDVDAAVNAAAGSGSDEAKYFCVVALRDNRENMDKNKPFEAAAGVVVRTALASGHAPTRKLAATHAHWVKGDSKDTLDLITKLLELLKDADQGIADAARDSIRQKVTELDPNGDEFRTLRAGLPAAAESPQAYTRANAVWVGHYLNNNAAGGAGMGLAAQVDVSLASAAWERDQGEPLVMAAASADLGRHGDLGQKIKVAKLLQQADCPAPVAEGAREGLAAMTKDKADPTLVGTLIEALGKGGPGGAAAGRLMGVHGTKKDHAMAVIDALFATPPPDEVAKAGLLEGGRALVKDSKADTRDKFIAALAASGLK